MSDLLKVERVIFKILKHFVKKNINNRFNVQKH